VNYPNCFLAKNAESRICVLYKNSPDAVSNITKAFADKGVTVKDMASKSKGDFAYSIIDFDGACDMSGAIGAIEGVIRVRVI
jgi:D-3-phosphoglycerate dehydrogenase